MKNRCVVMAVPCLSGDSYAVESSCISVPLLNAGMFSLGGSRSSKFWSIRSVDVASSLRNPREIAGAARLEIAN